MKPTILCMLMAGTPLAAGLEEETPRAPEISELETYVAGRDARLGWWREARFGMFVHWGVSSVLGGSWNGRDYKSYAEHIQRAARIPVPVYRKEVAGVFNPIHFDADAWVRLAKETGMGYFIITAKHHDGVAMYDSKVSDYDVVDATPWRRDPMVGLRDACRKHGIKFGFYYSHAFDWGEENGSGNDWDWSNPGGDKLLHGSEWWLNYPEFLPKVWSYVDGKAIPQILELIRNYHPDILWFDTPHKIPPEENLRIFAAVRKADPDIVINGRIFADANPELLNLTDYVNTGDKPGEFSPKDGDWEGVPTTNESFGYNAKDHSHKPPGHFIQMLAKAASRGGNILLNMGPRPDGTVDPADVAIFQSIGSWWKVNGESIRGTTRTPLPRQTWTGESTLKGNTLYLHVFGWPKNGELLVSGLRTGVKRAKLLESSGMEIGLKRLNDIDLLLTGLPTAAPHADDSVIALECEAPPVTDDARWVSPAIGRNTLSILDGKLEGSATYRVGRGIGDAWSVNWVDATAAASWPVRVTGKCGFDVSVVYDASAPASNDRLVEGDAGKELAKANSGAGGTFVVTVSGNRFLKTVRTGRSVREPLGRIVLEPGRHVFRIAAAEVTGAELFRPRALVLDPVRP